MQIELRSIDLDVVLDDEIAATLQFAVQPADAKAAIAPFLLSITVPRRGNLDSTVDAGFRAIHRLAQALEEKLRPGA